MWFVLVIFSLVSPAFGQGNCCTDGKSSTDAAVESLAEAMNAIQETPFLSLDLDAKKFRGATTKATEANVRSFVRSLGLAVDKYQDNDALLAVVLEKPHFSHKKGWLRKSQDDLNVEKVKALPFVEKISYHESKNGTGNYTILFKETNRPYETDLSPIFTILAGFKNTLKPNPAMTGTIWVQIL